MASEADLNRWDYYHRRSRRMWLRAYRLEKKGKLREDRQSYRPSPTRIEQRIQDLRWLQSQGFKNRFIACVMQYEYPTIEKVVHLIDVRGWTAARVFKFYQNRLPTTEYDGGSDDDKDYLNRYENLRPSPEEMRDFEDEGERSEGTPRKIIGGTKVRVLRRRFGRGSRVVDNNGKGS